MDDIVVTADGGRTFIVYVDTTRSVRTSVAALPPTWKQQWKRRHPHGSQLGRLIVSWTNEGYPEASVHAFGA